MGMQSAERGNQVFENKDDPSKRLRSQKTGFCIVPGKVLTYAYETESRNRSVLVNGNRPNETLKIIYGIKTVATADEKERRKQGH